MTMRVTVTNHDTSRKARITKRSVELGPDFKPTGKASPQASPIEIAPGETGEVWIHTGMDFLVEEV